AHVDLPAHDLLHGECLATDGVPARTVEGILRRVADDIDLGVLVPLPQDAAFSLGQLRRPPGAIDMVERYRATLDVRAGSHSFAGPDQYVDVAVSGLLEECSLLLRVAGLMDEADAVGVHPVPLHERFLELVVGVPLVLL